MGFTLQGIEIENFKSYVNKQYIRFADLSVLLGANSSGKSTALQALLVLKQTMECNSPDEELLLSGKYVALGDYDDVISDSEKDFFSFTVILGQDENTENTLAGDKFQIKWKFKRGEDSTSASLDSIDIYFENMQLMLKKASGELYDLYINGTRGELSVKVQNLLLRDYIMYYDKRLNSKASELLNTLIEILISPKTTKISSEKLVWESLVKDFYLKLMERVQDNVIDKETIADEQDREDLAIRIETLIEKFCSKEFTTYDYIDRMLPKEFRIQILKLAIINLESEQPIKAVLKKYEEYISDYEKSVHKIEELKGIYGLGRDPFWFWDKNDQKNNNLTQLKYALEFYDDFYTNIISKIFFVGPIRETPKGLYNIGFETIPKYVGPSGSYFASVLLHENKKQREYILPRSTERETLSDALAEWMTYLKVASAVDVDKRNSFGFSVSIENIEQIKSDIMNVGIGTSQVLPVLISVLLSEPEEILIFEQPELHLHPYSQSRLADMFVEFCKRGRKIIIETHSEYFLLRLRYHIVKGNCPRESISVNFFQNENGTKVINKNISELGNIEYPKDFKDETQELLDSILDAALKRRGL